MDNLDKVFKGQQFNEEFIVFFRQHWVVLIKEIFYVFLFFTAVFSIFSYFSIEEIDKFIISSTEGKVLTLIAFAGITAFFHRFFIKMFNYFLNVGIITDIRLIDHQKTLFFHDTQEAIDLVQIQDIERTENGILPNILGYGDIKIYINAPSAVMIFKTTKNAKYIYRCICRQKEFAQALTPEEIEARMHKSMNPLQPKIVQNKEAVIHRPVEKLHVPE